MSTLFSVTEVPFAVIAEETFLTFDHHLFFFGRFTRLTKIGKHLSKTYSTSHKQLECVGPVLLLFLFLTEISIN